MCVCVCVWLGSSHLVKHVWLNNKDTFRLYNFLKILSSFIHLFQLETKTLIGKLERILIKLYIQNVSLLFNQTCLYIYIYIYTPNPLCINRIGHKVNFYVELCPTKWRIVKFISSLWIKVLCEIQITSSEMLFKIENVKRWLIKKTSVR